MGMMLLTMRLAMTSNWEEIKKAHTEPGIFNLFLMVESGISQGLSIMKRRLA